MQIAGASLKLNLNIFLADFKVKYCKCVVKVKLFHQACSAAGLEMSFLRPQRVFTYAYCCCIKSRFLKSRGFDGDAAYFDVGWLLQRVLCTKTPGFMLIDLQIFKDS